MKEPEVNGISKEDFLELNEDDLMFITNPGRMGDEDGSTFVVKKGSKLVVYRVDGWLYPNKDLNEDEYISLDDAVKQFPKWHEAWKNGWKENYKGKYKYLYMGFGNGLSVDNSIYNEFEPYLNKLVDEYLEDSKDEELKYSTIYNAWFQALINMANDRELF